MFGHQITRNQIAFPQKLDGGWNARHGGKKGTIKEGRETQQNKSGNCVYKWIVMETGHVFLSFCGLERILFFFFRYYTCMLSLAEANSRGVCSARIPLFGFVFCGLNMPRWWWRERSISRMLFVGHLCNPERRRTRCPGKSWDIESGHQMVAQKAP